MDVKTGFFQLVNHGVPLELLERVEKVCAESYKVEREKGFMDSNPVQLLNKLVNGGNKDARIMLDNVDWEDAFYIHNDNVWPSIPKDFVETMKSYRAELKKLAVKVMEAMDENLGLNKGYIKRVFSGGDSNQIPFFGTKVSHYPPCPHPDLVNGLRSHTDPGGVILLFQDGVVGSLQILKSGEWIDVNPLPGSIVINTGDQIEVLSNRRYKSMWHRVLPTTVGNRLSVASFFNPSNKATILPATELINAAPTPYPYPEFVFGDYMSIYADQKFLAKEPRFEVMKAK